jgi:lysophospholipase L1-like esterase
MTSDPLSMPAAAATPALPSAAPPAPAQKRYVVAAIGDSLTDARGGGGKYLDLLRERCPNSRFDNFGKGGNMVNQMRRRLEREVMGTPDVPLTRDDPYTDLIVFGGVNDLYSDLTAHRTFDKITADLTAMYEVGRARGARIVAITVAPWAGLSGYFNERRSKETLRLNDWIRAQPVQIVVDAYPILSCGEPELLCPTYALPDRVHMSPEGHRVLGEAVFEAAYRDCL